MDTRSNGPKKWFPGYGLLDYLDPSDYFSSDNWQYESTEESAAGVLWDIVSRKDAFPCMDCRYTTIERG